MPIAFVNAVSNGGIVGSITLTLTVTAGNRLIVFVFSSSNALVSSIRDTAGNTFTFISRVLYASLNGNSELWSSNLTASLVNDVITVTMDSTLDLAVSIGQYSGVVSLRQNVSTQVDSPAMDITLSTPTAILQNSWFAGGIGCQASPNPIISATTGIGRTSRNGADNASEIVDNTQGTLGGHSTVGGSMVAIGVELSAQIPLTWAGTVSVGKEGASGKVDSETPISMGKEGVSGEIDSETPVSTSSGGRSSSMADSPTIST
jgi:hypothetical protein